MPIAFGEQVTQHEPNAGKQAVPRLLPSEADQVKFADFNRPCAAVVRMNIYRKILSKVPFTKEHQLRSGRSTLPTW